MGAVTGTRVPGTRYPSSDENLGIQSTRVLEVQVHCNVKPGARIRNVFVRTTVGIPIRDRQTDEITLVGTSKPRRRSVSYTHLRAHETEADL
eukprot:51838-Rhodomonas_salina.3